MEVEHCNTPWGDFLSFKDHMENLKSVKYRHEISLSHVITEFHRFVLRMSEALSEKEIGTTCRCLDDPMEVSSKMHA